MKKIHQSTLLRDFIGAAFCLVTAFVLVLMCTGCGDDLAGGTAEETNIVASLSNITVLGRVKNINEILEANNVDADSEKMIARMFELDSVTLDTVGKYFFGSYRDIFNERKLCIRVAVWLTIWHSFQFAFTDVF